MPSFGDLNQNAWASSSLNYANQVACTVTMPANGWITTVRVVMGGQYQNPWASLALWLPNGRLLWNGPGFQAGVGLATQAQTPNARISGGQSLLLGFWRDPNSDGIWGLDTAVATNWSAQSTPGTSGPTNFASTIAPYQSGQLSANADYVANATPNAGAWQSPTPSGTISDTNPTFSGTLPQNPADSAYDSVGQIDWVVYRTDTGQQVANVTWSVNSAQSSWTRKPSDFGMVFQAGVQYGSYFAYSDSWGAWAPNSAIQTFTINSGPNAPTATAPTGKQTTLTALNFTATYSHGSGLAAQNVEVQVLDSSGTNVLFDSGIVAKSVANNTSFTVAQWFIGLQWASSYTWWVRAQDTSGVWGPWSAKTAFATDGYPGIPVPTAPTTGSIIAGGSAVNLTATFSDADGDNLTSLYWDLWDTTTNTEVSGYPATVAGTFASGSSQSRTVTTSLTGGHAYKWQTWASDGTLTGTACAWQTFIYTTPPTVSITSPTAGQIATDAFTSVTISYAGSAAKASDRTQITDTTGGASSLVFDSGNVAGTRTTWSLPYSTLQNGHTYSITVTVIDINGISGTSAPVAFSATWSLTTAPRIQLLVNGTDLTANMEQEGWNITQNWARQADTASITLSDEHALLGVQSFVVQPLATVEIRDRNLGLQMFGGIVSKPKLTRVSPGFSRWFLQCASPSSYLQSRTVTYDYTNQTADYIVRDIVLNKAKCGITANHVLVGPNVSRFKGQNVTVHQALHRLCKLASTTSTYGWFVDGNSDIHFGSDVQLQSSPSGVILTDNVTAPPTTTTGFYESTNYEWDAANLRTRVLIQGATITRQTTEQYDGDGTTRSFRLSYPYQTNPESVTVTVNGSRQAASSQSGATTPWILVQGAPGVWSLAVQPGSAPPASGAIIQITYNYILPVVAQVQSAIGIASASGPNGGYWDAVITDKSLTDLTAAQARGQREVREYGLAQERVTIKTVENWAGWLNVGQTFVFANAVIADSRNNYASGISGLFLVIQMRASGVQGGYRYQDITAVRI